MREIREQKMALSKAHAGMKAKLAQILTHEEELNQTYEQVEERCVALEERHQQELAGLQAEHLCLKCKAVLSSAAFILLFACEETSQIMHAFPSLTSHFWRACIPLWPFPEHSSALRYPAAAAGDNAPADRGNAAEARGDTGGFGRGQIVGSSSQGAIEYYSRALDSKRGADVTASRHAGGCT